MSEREIGAESPIRVEEIKTRGEGELYIGDKQIKPRALGTRDAMIVAHLKRVGRVYLVTYPSATSLARVMLPSGNFVQLGSTGFTGEVRDRTGSSRVGSFLKIPDPTGGEDVPQRALLLMFKQSRPGRQRPQQNG